MPNPPCVGVVMGSASDLPVLQKCLETLDRFQVPYEARVLSAHRSPDECAQYARTAAVRGLKVLIAGAGAAAHLAGSLAAHTTLPVLGVPVASTPLQGLDSLFSTVQMPPGVPVATLAVGESGAVNAAVLAVQILALSDAALQKRLADYKAELSRKVLESDKKLQPRTQTPHA